MVTCQQGCSHGHNGSATAIDLAFFGPQERPHALYSKLGKEPVGCRGHRSYGQNYYYCYVK